MDTTAYLEPTPPGEAPKDALPRLIAIQLMATEPHQRFERIARACIDYGGTLIEPGRASHCWEIWLLEIYARGDDPDAMIRNWIQVVTNLWPPQILLPKNRQLLIEIDTARALAIVTRPDLWPAQKVLDACSHLASHALDDSILKIVRDLEAQIRAQMTEGKP